jgi:DnaJ-class molecular chaperone
MNDGARSSSGTQLAQESHDHAARAKTLNRVFAWCPKCARTLTNGQCAPCDEEEALDTAIRLEGSIRQAQNRTAPNRCKACDGSGVVESFSPVACYSCSGSGLR